MLPQVILKPDAFLAQGYFLQSLPPDWEFVFANLDYLFGGLVITVLLTLGSIIVGFAFGFPAGAIEVYGGRYSRFVVSKLGVVLRGTPIVVIFIFTFFVFPITNDPFIAAVAGLGMRSAAYQSQIFRGSILSVGRGQMEAARSVGLSKREAILRVIFPQAIRRSVPGFQNEFTIVLKDTSVAFAIGLSEILTRSFDLFTQETTAIAEVILFVSGIYFVLTVFTNQSLDYINRKYAIPGSDSS